MGEEEKQESPGASAGEAGSTPAPADELPDVLDPARGELDDQDLSLLEQAIDAVDFATRRSTPERLLRLEALSARLADVAQQFKDGKRKPTPERAPLTPEEEARYNALVEEGVAAGEKGDLHTAMSKLAEAVRVDPDGLSALFNLGVVYGLMAHKDSSKAEFYDDKTRDEVWAVRAKICYDRVLEQDPESLAALNNLATLHAMRDERDLAAELLRRMLAIAPQDEQDKKYLDGARSQLQELESI